jgi:hypothetical protein
MNSDIMTRNSFVMSPARELKPDYKLSPFNTSYISANRALNEGSVVSEYFDKRFGPDSWTITPNGRTAIGITLEEYNLEPDDFVTIFTTTGNRYISKCVTDEIEKICRWSRNIEKKSKLILVNHEFGFPFENFAGLGKYCLPIIEDCAYSFLSDNVNSEIGRIGDKTIYSFPKFFPVQAGGLLVSNTKGDVKYTGHTDYALSDYILSSLAPHIENLKAIAEKRRKNYLILKELFARPGMAERFEMDEYIVPGVFMFRAVKSMDLPALKVFMQGQGIECSVFYGEQSFYIPVHQNLKEDDLLYFYESVNFFIANHNHN